MALPPPAAAGATIASQHILHAVAAGAGPALTLLPGPPAIYAVAASLGLLALLCAALAAALLTQRSAARNASQLAAQLHLIATMERNARIGEARSAAVIAEAGNRLDAMLTEAETTLREDGATLRACLRHLETQGGNAEALTAQLEYITRLLSAATGALPPPDAARDEQSVPTAAASTLDLVVRELGRLAASLAAREAAAAATLQALRETQAALPAEVARIPASLQETLAAALDGQAEAIAAGVAASIAARLATPAPLETTLPSYTDFDADAETPSPADRLTGATEALLRVLDDVQVRIAEAGEAAAARFAHAEDAAAGRLAASAEAAAQATEAAAARLSSIAVAGASAGASDDGAAPAASTLPVPLAALIQDTAAALETLAAAGRTAAAQTESANAALLATSTRLEAGTGALAGLVQTIAATQAHAAEAGAALSKSADRLAGSAECIAAVTPILAALEQPLGDMPGQIATTLAEFAATQRAAQQKSDADVWSLCDTAFSALQSAASRAEAALTGLPAAFEAERSRAAAANDAFEECAALIAGHANRLASALPAFASLPGAFAEAHGRAAAVNASLEQSAALLAGSVAELASATPALAALPAPLSALLEDLPARLGATVGDIADAQRGAWQHAETALRTVCDSALAAIDHAAARADAALSTLPAEAGLLAATLDNATANAGQLEAGIVRVCDVLRRAAPDADALATARALPEGWADALREDLHALAAAQAEAARDAEAARHAEFIHQAAGAHEAEAVRLAEAAAKIEAAAMHAAGSASEAVTLALRQHEHARIAAEGELTARLDALAVRLETLPAELATPSTNWETQAAALQDGLARIEAALRACIEASEAAAASAASQESASQATLARLQEEAAALRQNAVAALAAGDVHGAQGEAALATLREEAASLRHHATAALATGDAHCARLEAALSQAESLAAHLPMLPGLLDALGSLETILTRQDAATAAVQHAAQDLAEVTGRTLSRGEAQEHAAERLLSAADAVRRAAAPREGLAAIPALAADCRALATELGSLARGIAGGAAPVPLGLAARAPALLAALHHGAEDLRAAATALALARDALPDAA